MSISFVPGRHLLDSVLVANEIVDSTIKQKKICVLFKVDFEKAYDCAIWDFLRFMMKRMGFGSISMGWMEACNFNSHLFILFNGSPIQDFKVGRGLRQGDPLSPFLL